MTLDIEAVSKVGKLGLMTVGRGSGKSMYAQYAHQWNAIFGETMPAFSKMANAIVDGEQWYTVRCNKEVAKWVRTMEERKWQEHIDQAGYINFNVFDMHEKLYTMLAIKFS